MNLEQKYDCVIAEHSLHETAEYVMNPSTYGFESNPLFWVKFDQIYNVMDKGKIIITLTPNHPEFLRDEIKFEMENAGFIHKETQTLYHHNNGQEILDLLFVGEK